MLVGTFSTRIHRWFAPGERPALMQVLAVASLLLASCASVGTLEDPVLPSTPESAKEAPTGGGPAEDALAEGVPVSNGGLEVELSDGDPDWFPRMLARSAEPLGLIEVAAGDNFFRASIPAELVKPVEPFDGGYLMKLVFGPDDGIAGECYVYEEAMDLAASLVLLADAIFDSVESMHGKIDDKEIYGVEAGNIGPVPYMGLAWLHRFEKEEKGQPIVGQAKHWLAIKEQHALYCQSTAVGYDESLFGLFRSLVESIEFAEPPPSQPYYQEVSQVRFGEQVVGVSHAAHRIDEDGEIEVRETTAMLLPLDQRTLQTEDSVRLDFSTLDGELLTKLHLKAQNGELVTELSLIPGQEDGWSVTGNFQGKALELDLGAAKLRSEFGQRLDFEEFLKTAEPGSSLKQVQWDPSLDPSQWNTIETTYVGPLSADSDPSHHKLKVATGPLVLDAVADDAMSVLSMSLQMGAVTLTIDRLHAEGDIWYPRTLPAFVEASEAIERAEDAGAVQP